MLGKILFNLIGLGMLVSNFIIGARLMGLAIDIRFENKKFIGKGWNGKLYPRQLNRLRVLVEDEKAKDKIDKFLYYKNLALWVTLFGFASLITLVMMINS